MRSTTQQNGLSQCLLRWTIPKFFNTSSWRRFLKRGHSSEAESASQAQSILGLSPMTKLRGKFGDRKAGTSIAKSEPSERDSATTGLEESDMSDREAQGELN
jgi:hypothetical protein